MVWFGWVGFYHVSTIIGYLMSNSVYTYILNVSGLVWFVGFYDISAIVGYLMPKCQILLIHIYQIYIICKHILLIAQLNGFKYCYKIRIILFTINYLFAHSYMVLSIAM